MVFTFPPRLCLTLGDTGPRAPTGTSAFYVKVGMRLPPFLRGTCSRHTDQRFIICYDHVHARTPTPSNTLLDAWSPKEHY
jgi:hypothetical protein